MSLPVTDLATERLVISLDFGTTFSGVAYVFDVPNKAPDVIPILEWPGELDFLQFFPSSFPLHTFLDLGSTPVWDLFLLTRCIIWGSVLGITLLQAIPFYRRILQWKVSQWKVSQWKVSQWKVSHWRLSHGRLSHRWLSHGDCPNTDIRTSTCLGPQGTDIHSTGLEGYRQPKVPTLILYDKNDPSKFKWGGQVTWRDPAVHGVKLLLDPDQKKPKYLPTSSFETDRNDLPKDPVDVASDFIGAIYKHALSVIESSEIRGYFNICEKEFILSVPAVWSDKAKDLTLRVRNIHDDSNLMYQKAD